MHLAVPPASGGFIYVDPNGMTSGSQFADTIIQAALKAYYWASEQGEAQPSLRSLPRRG
jgi:hypothetical protein